MRLLLVPLLAVALPYGAEAADYSQRRGDGVAGERAYVEAAPEYFAPPPARSCGNYSPEGLLLHADPRPRFRGYAICKYTDGPRYGYTTIDTYTRRVTQYREVRSRTFW